MIASRIAQRIAGLLLDAEVARMLVRLSTRDAERLRADAHLAPLFPALQAALAGDQIVVQTFSAAWMLMYVAICRLDHLQDDDPMADPLPDVGSTGAQYNLVFAVYLLAASMLDDLAGSVPAPRLLRLHRFWSDMMLRMVDGQQRDLQIVVGAPGEHTLDEYQRIAQAKTGTTFALAFGGLAILLTDDESAIAALTYAGDVYGTLIQYGDDLHDAETQPNVTLTLPQLLRAHPQFALDDDPTHMRDAFWAHLSINYYRSVQQALVGQPATIRHHISALFAGVFGLLPAQGTS